MVKSEKSLKDLKQSRSWRRDNQANIQCEKQRRGDTWRLKVKSLSRVWLLATPWTVACQAPLSVGFSRQEYWNGLPFPSPGDLPDLGIKPESHALQADSRVPYSPFK